MSTPAAARTAPEERVHRFMAEYEAQWQKAAPVFRDDTPGRSRDGFALWRELMEETARHHFLDPATAEDRRGRAAADALLAPMPPEQAGLDEVRNFTEREVSGLEKDRATAVQVSEIGTLVTTSGVLTVLDFGDDDDSAHPLERTVEPGSYPVDRVVAAGRNAAVRVRFSEDVPVSWHPASIPGSGHVIGVDAGSACLMDFVAYAAMSRRAKAAAFQRFSSAERPAAVEVPLGGADVGIAVDSGYGDGSYPVYWGVDAEGRVAQLVADFMVLAVQDEAGALRHR